MNAPSQFVALVRKAAGAQSLDHALVCAVVEQESELLINTLTGN